MQWDLDHILQVEEDSMFLNLFFNEKFHDTLGYTNQHQERYLISKLDIY